MRKIQNIVESLQRDHENGASLKKIAIELYKANITPYILTNPEEIKNIIGGAKK